MSADANCAPPFTVGLLLDLVDDGFVAAWIGGSKPGCRIDAAGPRLFEGDGLLLSPTLKCLAQAWKCLPCDSSDDTTCRHLGKDCEGASGSCNDVRDVDISHFSGVYLENVPPKVPTEICGVSVLVGPHCDNGASIAKGLRN